MANFGKPSGPNKGTRPPLRGTQKPAPRKRKKPASNNLAKKLSDQWRAAQSRNKSGRLIKPKTILGRILLFFAQLVRFVFRVVFGLLWRGTLVAALVLAMAVAVSYTRIPATDQLVDGRTRGSVTLMDRNDQIFAWRGDQFAGAVTVDQVSPYLRDAVIATEDRRFRWHPGIDPRGIASAIRINLREGRGPLSGNGGSTITQQVAKLLCLGVAYDPGTGMSEAEYEADCRQGSVTRKIREVPFAMALEAKFSKDEILAIYLNRAYLGAGARGFAAASQRYFNKTAAELLPQEAAMLAGLLVAPSYFAPTRNLARAQERATIVLGLMRDQGYLTSAEYERARANPATLSQAARDPVGGYFADWVMGAGPSFLTRDTTEDVIIQTTFDPRIQAAAEAALEWVFAERVSEGSEAQAAIVVMSADGAVRAMVGGRETRGAGQFNRAVQAKRQTGSAFKPFVYAAALDLGKRFDDKVYDGPLTINVPGSGPYSPQNYTNEFYGEVTLTDALANSLNTAAVRLSEEVGRETVRAVASQFGIESDLAAGPALALGVSESTLIEMTGAYAGILNGGTSVTPYGLTELRIQGEGSPLMDQLGGYGERVIQENSARQLVYMMHQVVQKGSGGRAALPDGRPVAGKTGTTQAARDAWFIGFTGDYVAGVWMGYDDNTPLKGVTGGGLPAEIWRETMARVSDGTRITPLPMIDPATAVTPAAPRPQAPAAPEDEGFLKFLGGIFRQ